MAREESEAKKKNKKKLLVFAAVFVIGLIIGVYLGLEVVPQALGLSQQSELHDCLTAKNLLSEEVDCFIANCSSESVEFCGAQ